MPQLPPWLPHTLSTSRCRAPRALPRAAERVAKRPHIEPRDAPCRQALVRACPARPSPQRHMPAGTLVIRPQLPPRPSPPPTGRQKHEHSMLTTPHATQAAPIPTVTSTSVPPGTRPQSTTPPRGMSPRLANASRDGARQHPRTHMHRNGPAEDSAAAHLALAVARTRSGRRHRAPRPRWRWSRSPQLLAPISRRSALALLPRG